MEVECLERPRVSKRVVLVNIIILIDSLGCSELAVLVYNGSIMMFPQKIKNVSGRQTCQCLWHSSHKHVIRSNLNL